MADDVVCTLLIEVETNGWKRRQKCGGQIYKTGTGPDEVAKCPRCKGQWSDGREPV